MTWVRLAANGNRSQNPVPVSTGSGHTPRNLLLGILLGACATAPDLAEASWGQPIGPGQLTPEKIQSAVMSFADTYQALMSQAWDEARLDTESPQLRGAAAGLKVQMISGAYTIAITSNPVVALLDMIVLVELQAVVANDHWIPLFGEETGAPLRAALDSLREEIWLVGADVLTEEEQEELRGMLVQWRMENPDQIYVSYVRLENFAEIRRSSLIAELDGGGGILSVVQLDPLAGLDPVAREVMQTRLFAERTFYYMERLPYLVQWRIEHQILKTLAMPETQQLLTEMTSLTEVSKNLSAIAESLPEAVAREREAAIGQLAEAVHAERQELVTQVLEGITAEREAWIRTLEEDRVGLRGLLGDLQATLEAGTELATAVNADLDAVDALANRLEPSGPTEGPTDSEPLNLEEVRALAETATVTVDRANELVKSMTELVESPAWTSRTGEFEAAAQRIERGAGEMLDAAFLRGLALIAVLLVGALAAGLGYRRLVRPAPR